MHENLAEVPPGILIGDDIYKNRDGRPPDAPGRVWYNADFDYTSGYRIDCRYDEWYSAFSVESCTPWSLPNSIAGELIYTRALRQEATGFVPTGCPMH